MPKSLRYAAYALAALAFFAAAAVLGAVWLGERKLERYVEVRVVPVPFTRDPAAARRGKEVYEARACAACHDSDGSGRVFLDERDGIHARAPNITTGANSAVAGYAEADWVRAIRHGVSPRGRALQAMPSEDYNRMNDADFAALVGYVRSLPPADGAPASVRMPLKAKALYGAGMIRDAAEKIDHRLPPPPP